MSKITGPAQGGFNFIHSRQYGAVSGILAETVSVTHCHFAVAEHCLHSIEAFCVSHSAPIPSEWASSEQ